MHLILERFHCGNYATGSLTKAFTIRPRSVRVCDISREAVSTHRSDIGVFASSGNRTPSIVCTTTLVCERNHSHKGIGIQVHKYSNFITGHHCKLHVHITKLMTRSDFARGEQAVG